MTFIFVWPKTIAGKTDYARCRATSKTNPFVFMSESPRVVFLLYSSMASAAVFDKFTNNEICHFSRSTTCWGKCIHVLWLCAFRQLVRYKCLSKPQRTVMQNVHPYLRTYDSLINYRKQLRRRVSGTRETLRWYQSLVAICRFKNTYRLVHSYPCPNTVRWWSASRNENQWNSTHV